MLDIAVNEIDRSVRTSDSPGLPGVIGSISDVRITCGVTCYRPKIELRQIGKYWTLAQVADCAPNSLLFKTRRAAKKFFAKPLVVRSTQQMLALYGKPGFRTEQGYFLDANPYSQKLDVKRVEEVPKESTDWEERLRAKAKALGLSDMFLDRKL